MLGVSERGSKGSVAVVARIEERGMDHGREEKGCATRA